MGVLWFLGIFFLQAEPLEDSLIEKVRWWKTWPDQQLAELLDEGLTTAPDIKMMQARLLQSQALAGQQRAGFLPTISASWSSNTQPRDALGFGFGLSSMDDLVPDIPGMEPEEEEDDKTELFTSGNAALRIDVPLDIWGYGYSNYRAAILDAEATAENQRGSLYNFSILIANAYYDLMLATQQLHFFEQENQVAQDLLAVTKLLHQRGEASVLDVLQQEQQLASVGTQVPRGKQQLRLAEQQLLVLLGRSPSETLVVNQEFPLLQDFVRQDLDRWMLKRADVLEAQLKLQSAEKRRYSAMTSMLPSLSVGGQVSKQANYVDQDWDSMNAWLLSTGASVTLFQGGNKREALRSANAGVLLAEENLKQVNLKAEQEVAQIALSEETQSLIVAATQLQLDAAKKAFEEAEKQYVQGLIPFTILLNTQRAYQQAKLNDIQSKREQTRTRLQSYLVLEISEGVSDD